MNFGIAGRKYLVTGANSGIGRAIAIKLGEQGATVGVHYLSKTELSKGAVHTALGEAAAQEVADAVRQQGGSAHLIACDLSNDGEVAALIPTLEAAIGPLDGLVNNAAACEFPDTVQAFEFGRYRRHYDVNLAAPTTLMSVFAHSICARPGAAGRIVNISTDTARAFPNQVLYGSSKAALEAMSRAAAIELGPYGITVNVIAPGPVQTGYIDEALEAQVLPTIPMRRLGKPEDIADAALFLLSDASAWVTGQIMQVAGGHAL